MIHGHLGTSRRALIGLGLGLWIILISGVSLRAQAAGPQWGLRLESATDGRHAMATTVDPYGLAWGGGLRQGDEVVSVDDLDATSLAGQWVPSNARQITFVDDAGTPRTTHASSVSPSMLALLLAGALLFAGLGGIVYRWSADATLGRVFLTFAASFATALAAAPSSRLGGYPFAIYATAGAGLVAAPSLLVLFMMFPRRVRWVRPVAVTAWGVAVLLFLGQLIELGLPRQTAEIVDVAAWLWTVSTSFAALLVAGLRARNEDDRAALAPLVLGTVVAVGPLILFVGLPRLLGVPVALAPEVAA
ncbi:MAG TPA: hypothetical protein VF937_06565, partial [Chloroflexota bacterium]